MRMRVLQVVQAPQRRGAEVFAAQLSEELRRLGQEVSTVYLYPHEGPGALELAAGDRMLGGRADHPLARVPGFHPGLLRRLRRVISELEPDVIQLNGARTVKYGAFCAARRPAGSKLVYRNIGSPKRWVRGRLRRWFYRRLVIPRMSGIVAVSRSTRDELAEFYDLTVPMAVIPNGVAADDGQVARSRYETRARTDTPEDAPVLLYVGSFSAEKRLECWLRVARSVHDELPGLVLWLVGDGPERPRIEQRAAALGLRGAVRLLGARDDVADYLRAADLFLLTSDSKGMPAVVLEAGLRGLPVVAFRVGGLEECVLEGETGRLIDPGDETACSGAVSSLLRDPESRSRMAAAARAWCRERFSIDVVARQYLDFYRVLGGY